MKKIKIFASYSNSGSLEQDVNQFLESISNIDIYKNISVDYRHFVSSQSDDEYHSCLVQYHEYAFKGKELRPEVHRTPYDDIDI